MCGEGDQPKAERQEEGGRESRWVGGGMGFSCFLPERRRKGQGGREGEAGWMGGGRVSLALASYQGFRSPPRFQKATTHKELSRAETKQLT